MTVQPTLPVFRNKILAALPPNEISLLRPHLSRVHLARGQSIYERGALIDYIYFVETGLLSTSAPSVAKEAKVVVDVFGRQWAASLNVLLTPDTLSFHETVVRLPGVARRIPAPVLRNVVSRLPIFRETLFRAIDVSLVRISQNAICQATHTLQQKLARWLITLHDLESNKVLDVTQDMLADTLAVKRPRLAFALSSLEVAGLIRHSRGRVQVCDFDRLEAAACECHARLNAYGATVFHRQLGVTDATSSFNLQPYSYCA